MRNYDQRGFGLHVLLIAVFVAGVAALAGYKVLNLRQAAQPVAVQTVHGRVAFPAAITSSGDLTTTGQALDQSAVSVDSGLKAEALDSDLDSLL